ncbi:MAG: cation:proton antiporter [Candidatus Caenarcaniphilales bacterium]|nr:cation:proton antiporter [Candidatus Caenarcaniphilales bacterium]
MHTDPVVPVLLSISLVLLAAKAGAFLAHKFKQPAVLGELLAGVIVGNVALSGFHGLEFLKHDHMLEIFSGLGVIILLFEVGLESEFNEMMSVGAKSLIVAIVGVVVPFICGYYVSGLVVPEISEMSKIFMGAILTATSVGITARVFQDLNFLNASESKIVLGAAVIDDILGLIILAVVSSMATMGNVEISSIMTVSFKAIGFVIVSVVAGMFLAKKTVPLLAPINLPGMILTIGLVVCFIGSYLANQFGLATIVGAFCMGLVLEDVHFKKFATDRTLEEYIHPISIFLVPIFFVVTGMHVDLSVFADLHIVLASVAISVVAILGKLICAWTFPSKEKVNRAIIGFGMVPRGEVGLIFASVGKSIGVVSDSLYAITVIVVILTTLCPPPILAYLIKKNK